MTHIYGILSMVIDHHCLKWGKKNRFPKQLSEEPKENSPAKALCSAIDTVCLEGPSQIKGSFGQCFLNCTKASVSMAGIWEQSSVLLRLGFLSQKPTRHPVSSLC